MISRHSKDSAKPFGPSPWLVGFAALALGLVAFWWWPESPVTLNEHQYDVAIALYRACNQQDRAAIEMLSATIEGASTEADVNDEQASALRNIVREANEGRWHDATQSCRELLDAQTNR